MNYYYYTSVGKISEPHCIDKRNEDVRGIDGLISDTSHLGVYRILLANYCNF